MDETFDIPYLHSKYIKDVDRCMTELEVIVDALPKVSKKPATIVFDFDETIFHNARWWGMLREVYFDELRETGDILAPDDLSIPVHNKILDIVETIVEKGYTPFVVSSRYPEYRDVTMANLKKYNVAIDSENVYLYNPDFGKCVCGWKLAVKRDMIAPEYDISLNIGDQESDLLGAFRHYKIPSFYTTPCTCIINLNKD